MKFIRELEFYVMIDIFFDLIVLLFYLIIKLFLEMGLNVIVDMVIINDKWFNGFYDLFLDYLILFMGVYCFKEEFIRRE